MGTNFPARDFGENSFAIRDGGHVTIAIGCLAFGELGHGIIHAIQKFRIPGVLIHP